MGQDMKNSKVIRFDIIARKMKSPQARSYIQPVGLVYDLSFILSCGLPRSLCPSLFNKIPIMAHLAADKSFAAVTYLLVVCDSIPTRHTGRMLKRETNRITTVCACIAAHDLQGADFDGARIREFDTALTAMHTLQKSLSESLQVQWQMEQQRADRMTRLAHELKNPLAII